MRLAAQAKLGFYPAPAVAIVELCKHLIRGHADPRQHHHVLDPCAGMGRAIKIIADTLVIPHSAVYAIELDEKRGKATKDALPEANVLAPCSFFSSYAPMHSFGFIYLNCPFDDELGGGGREETAFVRECDRLLVKHGVLVFVAPWQTFRKRDLFNYLDSNFKDARLYRFPEMRYDECVYIGVKRSTVLTSRETYSGYLSKEL
jgi:16S rRNA G1207 methylase RsmC